MRSDEQILKEIRELQHEIVLKRKRRKQLKDEAVGYLLAMQQARAEIHTLKRELFMEDEPELELDPDE